MSESAAEPSAEEVAAELGRLRVADLLARTASLLASLGYGKLAPLTRDLEEARRAIDALRAVAPLLAEGDRAPVQRVVANLQLAYAAAAAETGEPGGSTAACDT